jgi:hypothetical protein
MRFASPAASSVPRRAPAHGHPVSVAWRPSSAPQASRGRNFGYVEIETFRNPPMDVFPELKQPHPVLTCEGILLLDVVGLGANFVAKRKCGKIAPPLAVHHSDRNPNASHLVNLDAFFL